MDRLIEGRLCALGQMREEYLPLHAEYLSDPEVSRYLRLRPPITLEHQRAWFEKMRCSQSAVVFAVFAKNPSSKYPVFIGVMGLHEIDRFDRTARSGTIIGNKNYWGLGIGTEAKFLQLEYAFCDLELRWVWSSVVAPNLRSRRLLRNVGYRKIGLRPQCRLIEGIYYDEILYGISKEMWHKRWINYKQCHWHNL